MIAVYCYSVALHTWCWSPLLSLLFCLFMVWALQLQCGISCVVHWHSGCLA